MNLFFQERNVSLWIDAGQGSDLFVGFSLGVSDVKVMCFNILAAKIEIVPFFLDADEICSLLLELCTGLKFFWMFEVATLEVVLAAEEIRCTFFLEEKFVRWIDAGQGIDLIFDFWRW